LHHKVVKSHVKTQKKKKSKGREETMEIGRRSASRMKRGGGDETRGESPES